MNIVTAAQLIAMKWHGAEVSPYSGELVLAHPARVFARVQERGGSEIHQAVAWLHDSVEDTALTLGILDKELSDLLEYSFYEAVDRGGLADDPRRRPNIVFGWADYSDVGMVVEAVDAITHRDNEPNVEYWERLKRNPYAAFVKENGDVPDNFARIGELPEEDQIRLTQKWTDCLKVLRHRDYPKLYTS